MPNGLYERTGLPAWLQTVLIGRKPRFTLIRVMVLVLVAVVTFGIVGRPIVVNGPSMLPTFKENGIHFINRLAYVWHEPRRGDVVGISYSRDMLTSVILCKRIIGLPGETVEFVDGHVRINGTILEEPYVKYHCDWVRAPIKLSINQYFVVGDNRSMPIQDHIFGLAQRDQIAGKIPL